MSSARRQVSASTHTHDEILAELGDRIAEVLEDRFTVESRFERYVLAIASGWYGASDNHQTIGHNDYPENPRSDPRTNAQIVLAALDLMKEVDAAIEEQERDENEESEDDDESPPSTQDELPASDASHTEAEHEHP